MANRRVIVIGAGLAGLEAGRRLHAAGLDVLVLEREARAGGRAAPEVLAGTQLDPGGCVVRAGDAALRATLDDLGRADALELWPTGATAQSFDAALSPIDTTSFSGIAGIPGLRWRDAWRAPRLERLTDRFGLLLDAAAPERAARLDDRSVGDFARLYFGARALDRWVGPQITHATLLDPEQTSRVAFLLRGAPGLNAAHGSLRGGVGRLVTHLVERVPTRCGVAVEAIEASAQGRLRVHSAVRFAGDEDAVDAVVLATPAAAALAIAGALLVPAERAFLETAAAIPAIALSVTLRDAMTDAPRRIIVPAAERSPLAAIAVTPVDDETTPNGVGTIVTLLAQRHYAIRSFDAPSEAIEKDLLGAAARWLPALELDPVASHLSRWSSGFPAFGVGRYREIGHFHEIQRDRRRQGRRVYFAGDHLVTPSFDGALASGARAARAVLTDLGGR